MGWGSGILVQGETVVLSGQCHQCGEPGSEQNTTEVLEAAWLHRSRVASCNEEWSSTLYGENSFYRTDDLPSKYLWGGWGRCVVCCRAGFFRQEGSTSLSDELPSNYILFRF